MLLESSLTRLLGTCGDQNLGISRVLLVLSLVRSQHLLMVCLISSSDLLLLLRVVLLMRLRANRLTAGLGLP